MSDEPQVLQTAQTAMQIEPDDEIERVDGRTREGRAAKAAASGVAPGTVLSAPTPQRTRRRPVRETPVHEPVHEPARAGAVIVQGHNGEVLSRKRTGTSDPFAIDPAIIPPGWEYQWNAISVIGNTEVLMDQNLQMAENGWRPVPAERHSGRYMPVGHKGSIIRGGQRLEERPKVLSDEARRDDVRAAKQLVSDRNESLLLTGMKDKLGHGYDMSRKYRGTGGDVRMQIDPGIFYDNDGNAQQVPAPAHTLAEPGE